MKLLIRNVCVVIYGLVGIAGWYQYTEVSGLTERSSDLFSSETTVSYARSIVWYHSRGKLVELRSILKDDWPNDEFLKTRITNMLKHRTSAYIRDMNGWDTPIPHLGNWYQDNFDFDNFLDDVFEVCLNDNLSIEKKISYVTDIMEEYQNQTTQKMIERLKKKRN